MLRTATRRAMLYPETPTAAVAGGWWNDDGAISGCIGAWQAKGAASYAASILDLSGNGNDLFVPTEASRIAPSWNATDGWISAWNTALRTPFDLAQGYSVSARFSSLGSYKYVWRSGTTSQGVYSGGTGGIGFIAGRMGNDILTPNADYASAGVVIITYNAVGEAYLYMDGVLASDTVLASAAVTAQAADVAINDTDAQAFAVHNRALTSGEVATISAAMAAL